LITENLEKPDLNDGDNGARPHSPDASKEPPKAGEIAPSTPGEKSEIPGEVNGPTPKTDEEKEAEKINRPPQSWKNELKEKWNTIPAEVRQEIVRRENDVQMVLRENHQAKDFIGSIEQVVAPHMAWMEAENIRPMQAIQNMFTMEAIARNGTTEQKVALAAEYLLTYGVDLNLLDQALASRLDGRHAPAAAPPQQNFNEIVDRAVNERLKPFIEERTQQEVAALSTEIETFSKQPGHEHFEELKLDIADVLDVAAARGQKMDLNRAYQIAFSMRPELVQSQALQNRQKNTAGLRNAAASVSGSTAAPVAGAPVDPTNLRQLLANSMGGD
jgi:hypothetical protein